jgi:hypothetical protein
MSNNGYDPLDMLTIQQVADILQKSTNTIRQYCKMQGLRHVKRNEGWKRPTRIYIMRRDLENFIFSTWDNGK